MNAKTEVANKQTKQNEMKRTNKNEMSNQTMRKTNFNSIMTMRWVALRCVAFSWMLSDDVICGHIIKYQQFIRSDASPPLQPRYYLFIINCAKCTPLTVFFCFLHNADGRSKYIKQSHPLPIDEEDEIISAEPDTNGVIKWIIIMTIKMMNDFRAAPERSHSIVFKSPFDDNKNKSRFRFSIKMEMKKRSSSSSSSSYSYTVIVVYINSSIYFESLLCVSLAVYLSLLSLSAAHLRTHARTHTQFLM